VIGRRARGASASRGAAPRGKCSVIVVAPSAASSGSRAESESPRDTPAVFFDRDGTLIEEAGYLDRLENLRLFPYTVDALRLVARAGFKIVIVTNQSGVALGYLRRGVRARDPPRTGGAPRGRRRALRRRVLLSAPSRRAPRGLSGWTASAASRRPAWRTCGRPTRWASTSRGRSSSATGGETSGLAAAVGARGVLVRTGYGAKEERESPQALDGVPVVEQRDGRPCRGCSSRKRGR
jgi:D-glycero-D-manno-heptose 1,7-bisphosphate phosphatase